MNNETTVKVTRATKRKLDIAKSLVNVSISKAVDLALTEWTDKILDKHDIQVKIPVPLEAEQRN